jgi:hypothetical protein
VDLALEQAQLLLENRLLCAPVGPQQVLLVLEARPLLRERVDLANGVGVLSAGRRGERRQQHEDRYSSRCSDSRHARCSS